MDGLEDLVKTLVRAGRAIKRIASSSSLEQPFHNPNQTYQSFAFAAKMTRGARWAGDMLYAQTPLTKASETGTTAFGHEAVVLFYIQLRPEDANLPSYHRLPVRPSGNWSSLAVVAITEPPQNYEIPREAEQSNLKEILDTYAIHCIAVHAPGNKIAWLMDQDCRWKLAEALDRWAAYGLECCKNVVPATTSGQVTGDPKVEVNESNASVQTGLSWQEVAGRLRTLRDSGSSWTSYGKLAEQFKCSTRTVHKAIRQTPELQAWAMRPSTVSPGAQSLNEVVTDNTAQTRDLPPEDEAAIREYLKRDCLTPEERTFFEGLSTEDQLFFLDDPDKHQTILGRKP